MVAVVQYRLQQGARSGTLPRCVCMYVCVCGARRVGLGGRLFMWETLRRTHP